MAFFPVIELECVCASPFEVRVVLSVLDPLLASVLACIHTAAIAKKFPYIDEKPRNRVSPFF